MSFLLLFCHDQFADEGTVFVAAAAAAKLRCNSHKMSLFHLRRPPDDRSFNNFVPPPNNPPKSNTYPKFQNCLNWRTTYSPAAASNTHQHQCTFVTNATGHPGQRLYFSNLKLVVIQSPLHSTLPIFLKIFEWENKNFYNAWTIWEETE